MLKRLKFTLGAMAGLAALALGGATIAGATANAPAGAPATVKTPEVAGGVDRDTIQSGDQTTPDGATAKAAQAGESTSAAGEAAAGEPATGETAPASDGPGGHADEPGNANANVEQQGQN